jgi:hypothetical protein
LGSSSKGTSAGPRQRRSIQTPFPSSLLPVAFLFLAGCAATWADVRRSAPVDAASYDIRAVALARCVFDDLRRTADPTGPLHGLAYEQVDEEDGDVAVVRGGYPDRDRPGIAFPAVELRVTQESGVSARAELRLGAGASAAVGRAVWPKVACCAASARPGGCRAR